MNRKKKSTTATPARLAELLEQCGIQFNSHQVDQLWQYHQMLREHNAELNLTRIHQFENMVLKLYVDSILPGILQTLPSPLLDLGTGPGMPGIPLKIAFPKLEVYLAESRQRRVAFLDTVVKALGMSGLEVIGEGISPAFERPFKGVITRAVEAIPATLHRVSGCIEKGGQVIFMKGPACDEETASAKRQFPEEYSLVMDLPYHIPGTPNERRLVVFQRLTLSGGKRKVVAMKKHSLRLVESEKNEAFKEARKLLSARGIKKANKALVSGSRIVRDTLHHFPERCAGWISRVNGNPPPMNAPQHLVWYQFADRLFDELDIFGTDHPLLLVHTPSIEPWDLSAPWPRGCTLLVPFQDPENVGAIVRSATAFGVSQIILLKESAHPYHPKSMRASGGAVLHAHFLWGPSVKDLPRNLPVKALSTKGQDIDSVEFPADFLLLPGMEGPGLPEEWKASAMSIPMQAEVESLNAATATAIALYVWSRKGQGERNGSPKRNAPRRLCQKISVGPDHGRVFGCEPILGMSRGSSAWGKDRLDLL